MVGLGPPSDGHSHSKIGHRVGHSRLRSLSICRVRNLRSEACWSSDLVMGKLISHLSRTVWLTRVTREGPILNTYVCDPANFILPCGSCPADRPILNWRNHCCIISRM